jgi:cytoskeletal protein RodZ
MRDVQIGHIFRNMRLSMRASRDMISRRLATSPSTIDDFEAGAIAALPHWKETTRIVRGYCELLRVDPEPILWRIRSHLDAAAHHTKPRAPAPERFAPVRVAVTPPANAAPEIATVPSPQSMQRRRRRTRQLLAFTAPIVLMAALVYLAITASKVVYTPLQMLPGQIALPLRAGLDYLVMLAAPRRDGLLWIEVSDPRSRKGDKLLSPAR